MTGIGAINISQGASINAASNSATTQSREGSPGTGSNQQAAVSQVAAQRAGERLGKDEKARGTQTPARPEASFSSNQDEEHKASTETDSGEIADKTKQNSQYGKKLDLTA